MNMGWKINEKTTITAKFVWVKLYTHTHNDDEENNSIIEDWQSETNKGSNKRGIKS